MTTIASMQPLAPTLYAVVASLPRGARLEKEVVVHSGRFVTIDPDFTDNDGDEIERIPTFEQGDVRSFIQCIAIADARLQGTSCRLIRILD